jgi:hypothetical protein
MLPNTVERPFQEHGNEERSDKKDATEKEGALKNLVPCRRRPSRRNPHLNDRAGTLGNVE